MHRGIFVYALCCLIYAIDGGIVNIPTFEDDSEILNDFKFNFTSDSSPYVFATNVDEEEQIDDNQKVNEEDNTNQYPGDDLDDYAILGRAWNPFMSIGLETTYDESKPGAWKYEDKNRWANSFATCGSTRQSPVDITKNRAEKLKNGNCLRWSNYHSSHKYLTLNNNGHTIEATSTWSVGATPVLRGGPLVGTYKFAAMHWHWGSDKRKGSEHTLNEEMFPLELHLIHFKSKFNTTGEAVASGESDALAVVGILFKNSVVSNSGMTLLTKAMRAAIEPGRQNTVLPLGNLGLNFKDGYYTYLGSLTTPPCNEIVRWIVMEKPLHISWKQMNVFRNIYVNGEPLVDNYRSVQPLNGRVIQYYDSCLP